MQVSSYGPKHVGGIERVAHYLAKLLSERPGVVVEWCVSAIDLEQSLPGVEYRPMRTSDALARWSDLPYPFWWPGSLRILRAAVRRADVVHIHDYIYMGSLAAFVFAKWYKKPVVITQHISAITFRNPLLSFTLACLNRSIGRFILNRADAVAFVADHLQAYFQPMLRRPTHVILNGVDDTVFLPASSASERTNIRMELRIPTDKPVLLYVGRFVEKKGIHVLRYLAERTPHFTWVFIGSGHVDPGTWGLSNVIVRSPVSDNDTLLRQYYQMADLFVFPGQGEGFPLVLMEALACGLPVMISKKLLIPDPIPAEACVSVDDGGYPETTKDAWNNALAEGATPSALVAMRRAAMERKAPWTWDKTVSKYHDLYSRAARRASL